nr:hypothetical protein Iba_contig1000CG0010 [Ipomoea batatas]
MSVTSTAGSPQTEERNGELRDDRCVTHVEEDGQGRRDERGEFSIVAVILIDVVWLRCLTSNVARRSWGEKAIAMSSEACCRVEEDERRKLHC